MLLRYFQKQTLSEVGEALNLSENAARMRVERALGKLRDKLAGRGIATTGATLAAVLSANAIHAAPARFVATLSGAAIASGAFHASPLITATQTLTMTALHKTIIVAALAAAVGSGIYAVHQNTQLNARIRTLEAEQAPLSSQLQQLEKEQAQSAGQLAAMREENERLKTSAKVNEVLKLRGQVGVLRRQAAAIDARVNRPSGGLAKMMTDPAMKEFMQKAMTDKMRSMYEDLIKELNLTPEQTEQFLGILTGNASRMLTSMAAVAQGESNQVPASPPADVGTQLQAVLGDAGAGRFADFSRELPGRAMLKQLNDQLGDTALTEEQSSRLVQAIKAEPSELTEGMLGAPDKAFLGDQPEIDRFLEQVAQSNQRIVRQASAFLHPTQLDTLNTVLTKGIESRKLQAAAFFQKQ